MSNVTDAEAARILLNRLSRTVAGFVDQGELERATAMVKTKTAFAFLTSIANEEAYRPRRQRLVTEEEYRKAMVANPGQQGEYLHGLGHVLYEED